MSWFSFKDSNIYTKQWYYRNISWPNSTPSCFPSSQFPHSQLLPQQFLPSLSAASPAVPSLTPSRFPSSSFPSLPAASPGVPSLTPSCFPSSSFPHSQLLPQQFLPSLPAVSQLFLPSLPAASPAVPSLTPSCFPSSSFFTPSCCPDLFTLKMNQKMMIYTINQRSQTIRTILNPITPCWRLHWQTPGISMAEHQL